MEQLKMFFAIALTLIHTYSKYIHTYEHAHTHRDTHMYTRYTHGYNALQNH